MKPNAAADRSRTDNGSDYEAMLNAGRLRTADEARVFMMWMLKALMAGDITPAAVKGATKAARLAIRAAPRY